MPVDFPDAKDFPQFSIRSEHALDRMAEKRGDRGWLEERLAAGGSRFLLLANLSLAVNSNADRSETSLRWHSAGEIGKLGLDRTRAILLGCDAGGHGVFAVSLSEAEASSVPGGMDALKPLVDLRSLALQGALSSQDLSVAGMARALAAWHDVTRWCGRCGAETRPRDAGWRRECTACEQEFFPRADPAAIVLITDGTRCLLGHHKRYAHKFYSTLAGFVEPGEDIEACVRREMREETGITVGEVTYMASQPWPFPHLLMVGCWAQALTTKLTLEEDELHDARWFTAEEVRRMMAGNHADGITVPGPHSIAYALIKSFADRCGA
ncbi:NADH pyrophosphatase [bacterium BMS3Bbin10]|nr:NADH pyrophosphatase [bacterium BMS3Bbin10]